MSIIGIGTSIEASFKKDTKIPNEINEKILMDILKRNKKSEIGKKYNFSKIKNANEFKDIYPLTEYNFYQEYIEKIIEGNENILFNDKIKYFSHTSGTTGKQKLIPNTSKSLFKASKYMAFLMNKFAYSAFKNEWNYGRGLITTDILVPTYTKGNIPICSATSGGMKSIKLFLPYMYTSPIEAMQIKDKDSAMYIHILFALLESDLLYISGVFISSVLDLFRLLEKNHKALLTDIKNGYINEKINIEEATRKKLNKMLKANISRAIFLENEFNNGFKNIAKRIWPKVQYIATVAGANFKIYDKKLEYYIGNIQVYSPVYGASEGTIAINPYVKKIEYVIIPDTLYYEFILKEHIEERNPTTLNISELKVGNYYEIVITNYAGLYRYRLGDVIKVVGFYNKCPSIEFVYRKNQVLNMVSEKTSEEQMTVVIKNTDEKLKLNLVDYTTSADNSITPGRYIFYFEVKNKNIQNQKIENVLELELRKSNLAYARARDNKKIGKVSVILLKEGTFWVIKKTLIDKGASNNQLKIPRVITDNKLILSILCTSKFK